MRFSADTFVSTQRSLSFIVSLGQWFLIFPMYGMGRKNYQDIEFRWLSTKTLVAILFSGYILLVLSLHAIVVFLQEEKVGIMSGVLFHVSICLFSIFFISVAKKWPKVMREWAAVDHHMQYYAITENINTKIHGWTGVIMIVCIVEHLFFLACRDKMFMGNHIMDDLDNYFKNTAFPFMFRFFPYNRFLGFVFHVLNWLFTLIWNYVDAYLVVMCIPLIFRFRQIENKIKYMTKYKITNITHWTQVRKNFVRLSNLCDTTSDCIGHFLVVATSYKLVIILYQMLGVISGHEPGVSESTLQDRLYFVSALVIVIFRLILVTFYTSSIDIVCEDIVGCLFNIPSDLYNIEIDRLIISIKQSQPILNGLRLFEMRSSLILKMASVIVVYELVLIQFSIH